MRTLESKPFIDGFRMPAEFEPQARAWMLWPERTDIWPFGAKPAQKVFTEIADAISHFAPVYMGVSARQFTNARQRLPAHIHVIELSYNGCWIRDTGPTFVIDSKNCVRGVDWKFNAWGGISEGLYFPWDLDDLIPQKLLSGMGLDRYAAPLTLEGGAIHVDGEGTLLTTECCILNPNRNPGLHRQEAETIFRDYLGVSKTVWLPNGLYLDETGGHVDNLCAFVRPGEVVLAWTDDPKDPQYDISHAAFELLSKTKDARSRTLKIHKMPQPTPLRIRKEESDSVDLVPGTVARSEGVRLAASYINFCIVNGGVLVPTFCNERDEDALALFRTIFPTHHVAGINTRELLFGGGNIHCNVLQQPA